jgi:hypothetical protein
VVGLGARGAQEQRKERGEGRRREKEKEKEKEKGEGKRKEREEEKERERGRGIAPAPIAAGGRVWPTGSRAVRDETASRKKRRKGGTTLEIGCRDGDLTGRFRGKGLRDLGRFELNDKNFEKKYFSA